MIHRSVWTLCLLLLAQSAAGDSKILATAGALPIEGAAGGGITPWALIGGYGDSGEWGGGVGATRVDTDDFRIDVISANLGIHNRLELSVARQDLHVKPLNLDIRQNIFGAKLRVYGDLIYPGGPLISLGIQHKRNEDSAVPFLLGADDDSGTDVYISAGKLLVNGLLGRNLLLNGTVRYTEANQTGLLGFGSVDGADGKLTAELAAGVFLNRHWVIGTEYRQKPDNLAAVNEDHWRDVFVGWFPGKKFALVLAWSDLGDIAGLPDQSGWYLSAQFNL